MTAFEEWAKKVAVVVAALLICLALYLSNDASQRAKDLAQKRSDDLQASLVNNYERAVTSCRGATEIRTLLDKLADLLLVPSANQPPSEELEAARRAVKAYTGSNPTCTNLPPRPKGAPRWTSATRR